jgi:F-type H+-transporting ATPase subunit alpha
LDPDTKAKLERGRRIIEVLKQAQYSPMPVERQVVVFFAVTSGLMDDVPVDRISGFEARMLERLSVKAASVLEKVGSTGELSDETAAELRKYIEDFKASVDYLEGAF